MSQITHPKILFISGSLGLGHVTRDLAIVTELRKLIPDINVSWVSAPPASIYLQQNNESLLPESENWPSETPVAESTGDGNNMNVAYYFINATETWDKQWEVFLNILDNYSFDLIIGDETYRIATNLIDAALENKPLIETPFIIMYDFVGADVMTDDPREKEVVEYLNDLWQRRACRPFPDTLPPNLITRFFIGEPDDIINRVTDKGTINYQELTKDSLTFLGHIIRFNPEKYRDSSFYRKKLGYTSKPLVICSIGGSTIGKQLLELCSEAFVYVEKKIPGFQMVLACGPRIDPEEVDVAPGVETHGYLPDLIKHFAACDLAIILAGHTSSNELIALQKPFIYFPIAQHFEQEDIAKRLSKRNIGIEMSFESTTPELLAETIMTNIEKEVDYPYVNINGAKKAAEIITQLISIP